MILDVYTDPTDQDGANDADEIYENRSHHRDAFQKLMMPMIVTRTDALKFLTSARQELFVGVGKPECREH